jgi:glycosyl transferase family 25
MASATVPLQSRAEMDCAVRVVPSARLTVFFINRGTDLDRRTAIEAEIRDAGLTAERFSAVEGLAVPDCLRHYFFEDGTSSSKLTPGEVGCYASHLMVYRRMLDGDHAHVLVLEDDAILEPGFYDAVSRMTEMLPSAWDVVHLSGVPSRAFKPYAALGSIGKLVRYSRIPSGTVGYLISRRGAERFLAPIKREWPIDTDLRRPWLFELEVYGLVPRIIRHRSTGGRSPIGDLGGRSRRRRGLWSGNPLHTSDGLYFNIRTLGALWWASCWLKNLRAKVWRVSMSNSAT